jgi:hypothetical protein
MALQRVLETLDLLDGWVTGDHVAELLRDRGLDVQTTDVSEPTGSTTFITTTIPGSGGKRSGGEAPTTGIIGRLGGVGARPEQLGMVSDADGAVVAVAAALKLADIAARGDVLPGDVMIATHICPDAPTIPHEPVPFMGPPVPMSRMNDYEVHPEMDSILVVDATKGNKILNQRGFAITPTVKQGWILPVAPGLVDIAEWVTGRRAAVLALSTYDITPYGNGLYHVNSILQPAVATPAPVVGVALTAETTVPGTATGANHPTDLAEAVRFVIEAAKGIGAGTLALYDAAEFELALATYGPMTQLQDAEGS